MKTDELPLVTATDPAQQDKLRELNKRMAAFYNGPVAAQYYALAHSTNEHWPATSYHNVVRAVCRPGTKLLDLGCGTGHVALNLADEEIEYTGVDWSVDRVDRNRVGSKPVRFIASSLYALDLPNDHFDISLSFYVLEHLVWPHLFLTEMVRLTKPGGHLVIECPHFRPSHRIPSLPFGRIVAPLSYKIRRGRYLDAVIHLVQRQSSYPQRISKRFPRDQYPFLINLEPTCLTGSYYPDNDAVYFVDRLEVVEYLAKLGATDVTEEVCAQQERGVPSNPCLIVARLDQDLSSRQTSEA